MYIPIYKNHRKPSSIIIILLGVIRFKIKNILYIYSRPVASISTKPERVYRSPSHEGVVSWPNIQQRDLYQIFFSTLYWQCLRKSPLAWNDYVGDPYWGFLPIHIKMITSLAIPTIKIPPFEQVMGSWWPPQKIGINGFNGFNVKLGQICRQAWFKLR